MIGRPTWPPAALPDTSTPRGAAGGACRLPWLVAESPRSSKLFTTQAGYHPQGKGTGSRPLSPEHVAATVRFLAL